jgi:hypothetical protein
VNAAVEVSRLLSRCSRRRRSVEAAVKMLRSPSSVKAAIEIFKADVFVKGGIRRERKVAFGAFEWLIIRQMFKEGLP